jgi:dTDP-4-dehydrorhamnose 3,5-epimerase
MTMKFVSTPLEGLFELEFERITDNRGWFVRVYDELAFSQAGLCTAYPEHSESRNAVRGTIRGMHWQNQPFGECKVIRCTRGAVYDVLVDVRTDSPSFGRWAGFELREGAPRGLYVPPGFAHGYQTLEHETELHYLISERYRPTEARGIAYDSPALAIGWPLAVTVISERDRALPPFTTDRR